MEPYWLHFFYFLFSIIQESVLANDPQKISDFFFLQQANCNISLKTPVSWNPVPYSQYSQDSAVRYTFRRIPFTGFPYALSMLF